MFLEDLGRNPNLHTLCSHACSTTPFSVATTQPPNCRSQHCNRTAASSSCTLGQFWSNNTAAWEEPMFLEDLGCNPNLHTLCSRACSTTPSSAATTRPPNCRSQHCNRTAASSSCTLGQFWSNSTAAWEEPMFLEDFGRNPSLHTLCSHACSTTPSS